MSQASNPSGSPQKHGEVMVRLPGPEGEVGPLGAGAPQSMMAFSAYAVEVESAPAVQTIAADLIARRRSFAVICLPGDMWNVSVKSADQADLDAILKQRQIQWGPVRPELMRFGG
jgi:hypothetical protein